MDADDDDNDENKKNGSLSLTSAKVGMTINHSEINISW